jgi:hypothetical protein
LSSGWPPKRAGCSSTLRPADTARTEAGLRRHSAPHRVSP